MFQSVTINQSTCIRCGKCTAVCSKKILQMNRDCVEVLDFENWGCCSCGLCMAVCPGKAISVSGLEYGNFHPLDAASIPYDDFVRFLSSRRSVRRFSQKPVGDEIIAKLQKASAMAPVGAPPTNVKLLAIREQMTLDELLRGMYTGWKKLTGNMKNPVYRLILRLKAGAAKYNALQKHALAAAKVYCGYLDKGRNVFTFDAPAVLLFYGEKNGVCVTENCWLSCAFAIAAAHSLALGTVLSGMLPPIINMNKSLKNRIGIPADNDVFGCLLLGWPDEGIAFLRSIPRRLADVTM